MKIFKIVLTGGPCAGKTTALNAIKKNLEGKGIKYITIPETATELILNRMVPNSNYTYEFQTLVLERQYQKEQSAIAYAKKIYANEDKVVILCDRGIFDNIAYLHSKEEFQRMLKEHNFQEQLLLSSYDLVLNLFSLASCNPKLYSLNNEARLENVEEAKLADERTANAWANHYNIKLLDSSISLQEEQNLIIKYIQDTLESNDVTFKIKVPLDSRHSNLQKLTSLQSIHSIEHIFAYPYPNTTIRVYENNHTYLMQVVYEEGFTKMIIHQKYISQQELIILYNLYKPLKTKVHSEKNFIENKTHYKTYSENNVSYLDIQPNNLGKIILPQDMYPQEEITYTNEENHDKIAYIRKLWRKN